MLPVCLKTGGIACIISFHSGEDRRVKDALKKGLQAGVYEEISDDPILPTAEEIANNPRSRSAKLRWRRTRANHLARAGKRTATRPSAETTGSARPISGRWNADRPS